MLKYLTGTNNTATVVLQYVWHVIMNSRKQFNLRDLNWQMPLQSSLPNAMQMSCQDGINSVYACPRLFFSALRYSSDTLSKFPFCHTHKSLSWPSLVWLGWLWSLISVWHTVSLRTQSFPEALAKFWRLVGSWNFWLSYTVRKVRSIALQRCMSLGSLCQAETGENEDFLQKRA